VGSQKAAAGSQQAAAGGADAKNSATTGADAKDSSATGTSFLVTGGNDGIGLATVKELARAGGKVFLGSRSLEKGQAALAEIEANLRGRVTVVEIDITQPASVAAAVEKIKAAGGLDVLVNNAGNGFFGRDQNPTKLDITAVQEAMNVNFFGTVRVTDALLPLLTSAKSAVVFVTTDMASNSFMASKVGNSHFPASLNLVAYNTSKAALNSYSVAVALAFPKLKVNAVTPGYTATKLNGFGKHAPGARTSEQAAALIAFYAIVTDKTPTGKFFGADHTPFNW